jgi:hypothetical protein
MGIRPCPAEPRVSLVDDRTADLGEQRSLAAPRRGKASMTPGMRRNFSITQRTKPWDPTPKGQTNERELSDDVREILARFARVYTCVGAVWRE